MLKSFRALACLLLALPVVAHATETEAQARLFLDAYQRINAGKAVDMEAVSKQLDGYPLKPYLDYAELRRGLSKAKPEAVSHFLEQHGDLGVAGGLRGEYLGLLAKREDWDTFLKFYQPGQSAELRCLHLRALWAADKVDEAWLAGARELWESGSMPTACDSVFARLQQGKRLTHAEAWERTAAALERGDRGLAERMRGRLDPKRREWLDQWLRLAKHPGLLDTPKLALPKEPAERMLSYALKRAASKDPVHAMGLVERLGRNHGLSEAQRDGLRRDIAVRASLSQHPRALDWLEALPEQVMDADGRLARARLTLLSQNWARLLETIAALPEAEREDIQWRYWRGFALQQVGQLADARKVLAEVARERNYYGFLAADHLGLPYNLNHNALGATPPELAALASHAGVRRAEEFFRLGMVTEARREWLNTLAGLEQRQQGLAAALALSWGWYDRAIMTANAAGLNDALELRFPTPFRDKVELYSEMHDLEPAVIYAILRKESAFRPDAVSRVGALGLMQVMPKTGAAIARQLKEKSPGRSGLLDVDTNLRFGSFYLSSMLEKYQGNLAMAAAAYNAGPHRVKMWQDRNPDVLPTVWVEGISFYETRDYVKSILAFRAVFQWQLHGEPWRLIEWLSADDPKVGCLVSAQAQQVC